jgi:hypothetical protein
MKTSQRLISALTFFLLFGFIGLQAQQIGHWRPYDKSGVVYFEDLKSNKVEFDGVKVRVGGSFTQQFQGLSHTNFWSDMTTPPEFGRLYELESGFNLATANLNLDVALAQGVRLNLVTYLSSRHHPEAWVKGGFIQFDELPFLESEFFDKLMEKVTIRVGHMEVNYGDSHFRRTDNGNAMYNPFVGNYIVDAFNTEIGGEVYYQDNGLIAMLGLTGGEINGNVGQARTSSVDDNDKRSPSIIGKLGFDKQLDDNVRLRLMGSVYTTQSSSANHIFTGDRGGSRYYLVMEAPDASAGSNFRSGRYSPGFSDELTSFQFNAFLKASGLEIFGTFESASGRAHTEDPEDDFRNMTQFAADVLYRIGAQENFYIGGRYNTVTADDPSGAEIGIDRLQLGAGWFVTNNILFKLEYVNQDYKDFPDENRFREGNFNGVMIEAVVGF